MPRQARLDAPGTLHHVIVRGIEKRRIVDDRKDRENFVKRMGELDGYSWCGHSVAMGRRGVNGRTGTMSYRGLGGVKEKSERPIEDM